MITLTDVEVSPDFAHAKVFFTPLGDTDARALAETGLRRASGFLRKMLGKTLKVYNTPELHFIFDASVESGIRISQLIDEALAPPPKPKHKSANRGARLGPGRRLFFARVPGGKPARADHIFG